MKITHPSLPHAVHVYIDALLGTPVQILQSLDLEGYQRWCDAGLAPVAYTKSPYHRLKRLSLGVFGAPDTGAYPAPAHDFTYDPTPLVGYAVTGQLVVGLVMPTGHCYLPLAHWFPGDPAHDALLAAARASLEDIETGYSDRPVRDIIPLAADYTYIAGTIPMSDFAEHLTSAIDDFHL